MNVVIVESPNKIKKITKILPNNFKVLATAGHFRDLPRKTLGIDIKNNFSANFQLDPKKKGIISKIRLSIKNAITIYIASDPDREGEGIAWHIIDYFKLKYPRAKRMRFNEITESGILSALEESNRDGCFDMNLVDSYFGRRFSDRIIGYKASPFLWRNIKNAKSVGRVQSVATKMVIDKENKIKNHDSEQKFNINGFFSLGITGKLKQIPKKREKSLEILNLCKEAIFTVEDKKVSKVENKPPPPFKTSVFQQEAGKRFNISPKEAMQIAQKLYEKGKITYHRTDTTRLSDVFKESTKEFISNKYGENYLLKFIPGESHEKKDENSQNAHEAIRPTKIRNQFIEGDKKEKLIYRMIWVRAVASLMANEICDLYTIKIILSNSEEYYFISRYLKTLFKGYTIITNPEKSEANVPQEHKSQETDSSIIEMKKGEILEYVKIESKQTYTQAEKRYTESTLVKDLEKRCIGRPSTYASIITKIQVRNYVTKKKSEIEKKSCFCDILEKDKITSKLVKTKFGDNKIRLFPTSLGIQTNNFLEEYLSYIVQYEYTTNFEKDLDKISKGNEKLINVLSKHTSLLLNSMSSESDIRIQNSSIGKYQDKNVNFYIGKYGPFVKWNDKCYSVNSRDVTIEEAIKIIQNKEKSQKAFFEYECKIGGNSGILKGIKSKYGNTLVFFCKGLKSQYYFVKNEWKQDDDIFRKVTLDECLEQVKFVKEYRKKNKKK